MGIRPNRVCTLSPSGAASRLFRVYPCIVCLAVARPRSTALIFTVQTVIKPARSLGLVTLSTFPQATSFANRSVNHVRTPQTSRIFNASGMFNLALFVTHIYTYAPQRSGPYHHIINTNFGRQRPCFASTCHLIVTALIVILLNELFQSALTLSGFFFFNH